MMDEKKTFWKATQTPLPRLLIEIGSAACLIQWANVNYLKASDSYKNIEFVCEHGIFKFIKKDSMLDFFEALQFEMVRKVTDKDVKIIFIPPKPKND